MSSYFSTPTQRPMPISLSGSHRPHSPASFPPPRSFYGTTPTGRTPEASICISRALASSGTICSLRNQTGQHEKSQVFQGPLLPYGARISWLLAVSTRIFFFMEKTLNWLGAPVRKACASCMCRRHEYYMTIDLDLVQKTTREWRLHDGTLSERISARGNASPMGQALQSHDSLHGAPVLAM